MSRRIPVTLPPPPDLDPELLKKFEEKDDLDAANGADGNPQDDEDDEAVEEPKFKLSKEQVRQYAIGGVCFLCLMFAMYIVAI